MSTAALAAVESAAVNLRAARAELLISLELARDAGHPLRAIAAAAGQSYETVRRLTATNGGTK